MAQVLRIETELGGRLNSVPFVWTAGPRGGDGNVITSLAKVAPVVLSLIDGTRQVSPLSSERVQETFSVIAKPTESDSTTGIIKIEKSNQRAHIEAARLAQVFREASEASSDNNRTDTVYLVDQTHGEAYERRAVILAGRITQVDHNVVDQGMQRGYALFTITVTRLSHWEYGEVQTGEDFGKLVANHGGTYILPSNFASVSSGARIPVAVIRSGGAGGWFKKMWLGIKPNQLGFDSFDPRIRVGGSNSTILSKDTYSSSSDGSFHDSTKMYTNFVTDSNWALRFRCPMSKWNTDTATEENRKYYLGNYHLMGRIRTAGDSEARYGIRAGTGWQHPSAITWAERLFVNATHNSAGDAQIKYINFGTISIGGGRWNGEIRDRLLLESFNIYMECALHSGDPSKCNLEFDDMFLVPADHYLHIELDNEIDASKRVEIFSDEKGDTVGFVVESGRKDTPGKPLSTHRKVYSIPSKIVSENWMSPPDPGSVLVIVGDRDDENTKALDTYHRIDISARMRTEAFSYINV